MIDTFDTDNFINLETLTVDKTKPTDKRLSQYIAAVKNPYTVRVGNMVAKIEFTGKKTFQEALLSAFQNISS